MLISPAWADENVVQRRALLGDNFLSDLKHRNSDIGVRFKSTRFPTPKKMSKYEFSARQITKK